MNQESLSSSRKSWAKLVAISQDHQNIALEVGGNPDIFDDNLSIYQNLDGQVFLKNLWASSLHIDGIPLEIKQVKRLFGGEKLCLNSTEYVFCFTDFHSSSHLKRSRNEATESHQNLKKLAKIENDFPKELTCSICTGLFQKCLSLTPCQHTFCSSCLFHHLKSSNKCPLCSVEAVFVAKNPALSSLVQLTADNFPALQRPPQETTRELDFSGNIIRDEKGTYIGSLLNEKKSGQGTMIYNDGRIYEGGWRKGKRHGKGVQVYPDGGRYDGYWKKNERHGTGKFVWADGQEYEGGYQESHRHGFGMMKFLDGRVYKGKWKDGIREGKGILTFPDGDRYEGEWADDTLQPKVTVKYSNGEKFKGEINVRNFEKHGIGVLTRKNRDKCYGTWKDDVLQPQVKMEYVNGEKYVGGIEVESFKKLGRGVLTFKNGDKFDGSWLYDKKDGIGREIYQDGKRTIKAAWMKGRMGRNIIMTDEDGVEYEAELRRLEGQRIMNEEIGVKIEADLSENTICYSATFSP